MDRVERLTNLVLVLLHTRVPMTLQEVADALEGAYPDRREARRQAFERDKRLLREEGIDVSVLPVGPDGSGQPQFGYLIRPEDYYLPDLELDADEQIALNLAVAAVRLDEGSGRDVLWKLGGLARDAPPPLAALPALPQLPVLHEAIRSRRRAAFCYRGRPDARHLEPYGMVFRGGFWYVVGRDRDRGEQRVFRVDRIEGDVEVGAPAAFERPEGFDAVAAVRGDPWRFGEGDERRALVLVDRVQAPKVEAELGSAAVVERRDGGEIVVTLQVTSVAGFRPWLLGLVDHAVVIGPPPLRAEVVSWLEAMAAAPAGGPAAGSLEPA
ncbi:MAG TPA: WYL domain-containing protein [Acidimicrobiales bacterium]